MWSARPRTHAANFISTQSGSWGSSSTWGGAGVPGAGDDVTISGGTTVTEDGDRTCANLTVNGTLDMTNDFLFFQGTTFTNNGTVTSSTPGGEFRFNGVGANSGQTQTIAGIGAYGGTGHEVDLHIVNFTTVTPASGTVIGGVRIFTIDGGSALSLSETLTATNTVINNNGAISATGSGLLMTQNSVMINSGGSTSAPLEVNTGTTTANGNFGAITIDNTATLLQNGNLTPSGNLKNLTVAGGGTLDLNNQFLFFQGTTFTNNGTVTSSTPGGEFRFNGVGANSGQTQIIAGAGAYGGTSHELDLHIVNFTTVTPASGTVIGGVRIFTIDGGSVLSLTNTLVISNITINNNGTISASGNGLLKTQGSVTLNSSSLSAPLEVVSGTTTGSGNYGQVTIDNSATLLQNGNLTPNGNLTIAGGGTLDLNNQFLFFQGATFTNNGTVTSATPGGEFRFNGVAGGGGTTQNIAGAGAYGPTGSHDVFLHIVNFTGVTPAANAVVSGPNTITIDGASSFALTNPFTISNTTVQNNGSITASGSGLLKTQGSVTLNSSSLSAPLEVVSGATTGSGNYGQVTVDNSATLFQNGDLAPNGNLTIISGGTLDLNNHFLLFQGATFTNNGTVTSSAPGGEFRFNGVAAASGTTQNIGGAGLYGPTGSHDVSLHVVNITTVAPAVNAVISGPNTITIDGASSFALTNPLTISNTVLQNNGSISATGNGLLKTQGSVTLNSSSLSAPLEVVSGTTTGSGNYGQVTVDNSATLFQNGDLRPNGNLTITSGGTLDLNNHFLLFQGATFTNNGTVTSSAPGGEFRFNGVGANSGQTQTIAGTGAYGGTGHEVDLHIVNFTTVTPASGTEIGGVRLLTIDGGSGLSLSATLTVSNMTINNNGAISATGSGLLKTQNSVTINSGGSTSAPLEVNTGTTTASGNFGAITIDNTAKLFQNGNLAPSGNLTNLTVAGGGTLDLNNQFLFFQGTTFTNNGTVTSATPGGEFRFNGVAGGGGTTQNIAGAGAYGGAGHEVDVHIVNSTTVMPALGAVINGVRIFTIDGGSTLSLTDTLVISNITINNNGSIAGAGTLRSQGPVTLNFNNSTTAPFEAVSGTTTGGGNFGKMTIDPGATFVQNGNLAVNDLTNNGTLNLANQFLFFQGTTFTNGGTMLSNPAGGEFRFNGVNASGGTTQHVAASVGSFDTSTVEHIVNFTTVVLDGDLSLSTITIDGGSSFNITNHTLRLSGPGTPIFVNGSIVTAGSTIEYNGTSAQNVQNNLNGASYNNLTINNAAGVTLPGNITIPATLTLVKGVFHNGAFLAMGNGATIARSDGSLENAPTFNGIINIIYFGTNAIVTGFEIPGSRIINNLTDSKTNTVTLDATLTVNGNCVVSNGATLTGGAGVNINFNGASFTNDGLVSNPRVQFGGATQALSGAGSFSSGNTLAILGGSTTTLNSNHQLGSLNINAGGTFAANASTINLSGNWTNNSGSSAFNGGSGTVVFNGSSAQSIGGSQTTAFNALTSNNSNGLSLNNSETVGNTLTLTSGTLSIGANTLTLNGAISSGGGTLTGGNTSNITFGGSVASITLPAVINGLNNLTINRANGINEGADLTIGGTLALTNGAFAIGAHTLTLNGALTVSSGGGTLTGGNTSNITFGGSVASTTLPAVINGLNNLMINRANGINEGADLTIGGTLALTNGAFAIGAHTLTLNGPLTVTNGSLTGAGSSNMVFGGSGSATLPAVSLQNLTINRAGGISLGGDVNIAGTLALTSGNITTGSNTVFLSNGAVINGGSSLSYVNGNFSKLYNAGANAFTFPIGTANGFSPLIANSTAGSGSGSLLVHATQSPQPNFVDPSKALKRYWTLTAAGIIVDLTFNYPAGDVPGTANENNFVIFKYDGRFTEPGGTVNPVTHTASINGVTSFSDWTVAEPDAEPTPLTLQFSSPTYRVGEGDVRVNITVTRSGDTSGAASVAYSTIDDAGLTPCYTFNGTASPRCDYINTLGTLTWAAGDASSKTFSVAIVDDSYAEGDETFRVGLSNPTGASLGVPATATVTIIDNDTVNGPNPIDGTNFFVRQQYIDFLGREPDDFGFNGWVSTINNCSGDTTQCDRIHVSQLFFQSDEFQSRGYYVYRFYDVAFGRKPFYAEFVPDLASVSGFLTTDQLEAAKAKFAEDFVVRPPFSSIYGGLDNTQYVDTLLSTAGVTLSTSTRQSLIDGLNGGTLTRGQVLRQIAESSEVQTKYFNQAYAVMEYFGYLRREPDAFYLDWIKVLDSTGDPRSMVTGFVNSIEYRQRFGPP